MSVEFNEPNYTAQRSDEKTTTLGRLFMKLSGGMIKNQAQANKAILAVALVAFVLSIYLFTTSM